MIKSRKKKKGFTLAEVLITLGIIGVVASITIPVLMNNIQDAQFKTAYKKAYSVANQALQKATSENLLVPASGEGDATNHIANFFAFMSEFKIAKQCINDDYQNCWDDGGEKFGLLWNSTGFPQHSLYTYAFIDNSGVAWCMYYYGYFAMFIDVNGFKGPNQWGKDRFVLRTVNEQNAFASSGTPVKFGPYADNPSNICTGNKCATQNNYYGTSWLYN